MNQRKSEPTPYKVVRQFTRTRACACHAVLRRTSQNLTFGRREQRDNESDTWLFALAVVRLRPPDVVNDRRRRVALFIKHLMTDRFASSACAPCSTGFVPPRCYRERRCCKRVRNGPARYCAARSSSRRNAERSVSRSMPRLVRGEITSCQMSSCGKPTPDGRGNDLT